MKLFIKNIEINLKQSIEKISFSKINYFYGQMGAGKTSIVKLIDYCFGNDFEYTPAMQQEFNSAKIVLFIEGNILIIERFRDSEKLSCTFKINKERYSTIIPIKPIEIPIIPKTEIYCISDLIFTLAGLNPPKVRKSKLKEDTILQRLTLRNLMWYCYLDQDQIDSSFFNLENDANNFKRLQSRDVLRYIIGFHQEKVSQLEQELIDARDQRRSLKTSSNSLQQILDEIGIHDVFILNSEISELETTLSLVLERISKFKNNIQDISESHYSDEIKLKINYLISEIDSLYESKIEIEELIKNNNLQLNEIQMMLLKINRSYEARKVLNGVDYISCPSCSQNLKPHKKDACNLCGNDIKQESLSYSVENITNDTKQRVLEINDANNRYKKQLKIIELLIRNKTDEKKDLDKRLDEQLKEYNSAYLANILALEEEKYSLQSKIKSLKQLLTLPKKVRDLLNDSEELTPIINEMNEELKEARKNAEKDTTMLKKLEETFFKYLLDSKFPGVKNEDKVKISSPSFLPEVIDFNIGDLATTSFTNVSSGGKKTLFKSCFALAVHKISSINGSILPSLLIIDSPMKNISERENLEQFESFFELIYKLKENDLSNDQIIIVDKEYYEPNNNLKNNIFVRHMKPNSKEFPPLIPYYNGH